MKTATKLLGIAALGIASGLAAQSVQGIDATALLKKADQDAKGLSDFVHAVQAKDKDFQPQVQALSDAVTQKLASQRSPSPAHSAQNGQVDLDEMVAAAGDLLRAPKGGAPMFMVFASTSMPAESLRPLIRDTSAAGGIVVFRGFPNNSAREFMKRLREVVGKDQTDVRITIDPRLFRAFNVSVAPTFVVAATDFVPCDTLDCVTATPPADRLSGNVTVQFALERLSDARGAASGTAAAALRNLGRNSRL